MPSRDQLHDSVRLHLKNRQWRDYAIAALNILEGGPALVVNLGDGGTHDIPFMEVYCQGYRSDLVAFEDLILTAIAWQKVLHQKLIYSFIEVREPPYGDKAVAANKDILDDMVRHYGHRNLLHIKGADFWGGTQDADGFIEFYEPFIGEFSGYPTDGTPEERALASANPVRSRCTHFPLEVGYCMPDQMEAHLLRSGCVARYPYGSRFIIFLEAVDVFEKNNVHAAP